MKLAFLKILQNLSFRNRITIIIFGVLIGSSSLFFTWHMTNELKDKERYDVELWALAMKHAEGYDINDPISLHIIKKNNNIPFIITDLNLKVKASHLIESEIINHPDRLREQIEEFSHENPLDRKSVV